MEDFQIELESSIITENETTSNATLLYEFGQSSLNGVENNPFKLKITNPDNPMFLFFFQLEASDFPAFKDKLKLYCEYPELSQNVNEILTRCTQDPEFYAVVDLIHFEKPVLMLHQKTRIALLTPFMVQLNEATDKQLNVFLNGEAKRYKLAFEEKEEECQRLKEALCSSKEQTNEVVKSFKQQFAGHENESQAKLDETIARYENKINELKAKYKDSIRKATEEKQESEGKIKKKYEEIIENLREQNNELNESKTSISLENERSKQRIVALEQQVSTLTSSKNMLEQEKSSLTQQVLAATSSNAASTTEVTSLKETISMMQATLSENKQILEANSKTIDDMQEKISKKDQEIAQIRSKLSENNKKAAEHDWIAAKSKQVIEKFIEDTKKLRSDIASQKSQISALEKNTKELQIEGVQKSEKIAAQNDSIQRLTAELKSLREVNDSLKAENAELKEKADLDSRTITMLNNKLNALEIENETERNNQDPWKGVSPAFRYASTVPDDTHSIFDDVQFF